MDFKNCKARMILRVDYSSSKNQAKVFFSMDWERTRSFHGKTVPLNQKDSFAILGYLNLFGFAPTLSSQSLGWDNLLAMVLPCLAAIST